MEDNRLKLQTLLETLLGSREVYYQSPGNHNMSYPAIKYKKDTPRKFNADDRMYVNRNAYEIIVIDRLPNNPVIEKLIQLPMCTWIRWYAADGLNHDVLRIYI